jgi:hypothetical protein
MNWRRNFLLEKFQFYKNWNWNPILPSIEASFGTQKSQLSEIKRSSATIWFVILFFEVLTNTTPMEGDTFSGVQNYFLDSLSIFWTQDLWLCLP